ncbi:MAG: GGDEF domain-containing protein [Deltaproteobacteria bacterium]|nr:GGDEF domain-containing protein [Deltaproteobacteria bacterium]
MIDPETPTAETNILPHTPLPRGTHEAPFRRRFTLLTRQPREAVATILPIAGAVLVALLATQWEEMAPQGALPPVIPFLGLALAATACMLHRPFESSTLGVGAAVIAPTAALFGALPAALTAGGAQLVADLVRRVLRKRSTTVAAERRRRFRSLELAGGLMVSLTGAAAIAQLLGQPGQDRATTLGTVAIMGGAYVVIFIGLKALDKRLRRPHQPIPWAKLVLPFVVDLVAWGGGLALARVALGESANTFPILLAGTSLLSLEAARHALRHGFSKQRVEDLERLSRASRRIASNEPGIRGMAERIHIECSNVLTFQWFQFELLAREPGYRSWWTGPERRLEDGVPQPPPAPPPLPGIHRRGQWRIVERALETEEQLLGRLRLWCDPRQLGNEAVGLLDRLLPQMSASVGRALLDIEAKQDPLTGLALRRVLEERLMRAYRASCRHGLPMSIVMCDLDHFKNVNDTYGHAAGDQALVATAQLLLTAAEGDPLRLAARYGGEEFVLLFEETTGEEALKIADQVRQQVEALRVEVDGEILPLTMSLGVATFPDLHVKRPEDLQELADEALYEAKHRGRNRSLRHLGRGRFRTVDGQELQGSAEVAETETPHFFA